MTTVLQDLRYGLRLLVKSPVFTIVTVLSLALGIGANTTIFTVVNAVLLAPLPFEDSSRLVSVFTTDSANRTGVLGASLPTSPLNARDYREKNSVFSGVVAQIATPVSIASGSGEPEQVFAELVSGDYFPVIGVKPALGRAFLPDEDSVPGRALVTVIGHGLWQRRFGADPSIVGRTVTINNQAFTVVGVAPRGFRGTNAIGGPELWLPMMSYPQALTGFLLENIESRRALLCFVTARLKPGVSIGTAEANLKTIAARLEAEYPNDNKGRSVTLLPLAEATINPGFRRNVVVAGTLLMTIVALVLLIACANVANLLLARAAGRHREIAVRMSIGAGRARLARQLITESVLLGALGGVAGLVVAYWGLHTLWSMRPVFLNADAVDLSPDARVLAFTTIVSLFTGVVFGLAPALHGVRADLVAGLKDRSEQPTGVARWFGLRSLLVVGQVALSIVALIAAGLFLRSFQRAQRIDPGFDADRLAVVGFDLSAQGYNEARGREFQRTLVERVSGQPGVSQVAFATSAPFLNGGPARTVFPEGVDTTDRRNGRFVQLTSVTDGYFSTVGIPLVEGRAFDASDTEAAPQVVVLNETAAKVFWPGQSAVGKRFKFFGDPNWTEVVGVARNAKYNFIGEDPIPFGYQPFRQAWDGQMTLHVRANGDPAVPLGAARQAVQQMERTMPLTAVFTLATVLRNALWAPRMAAMLLGVFAGLSLLLASVGLYGLLSYNVSQRRREMGIRLALGATRPALLLLVVRHAAALTLAGVLVGVATAAALGRSVESLLYGIGGLDLVTFVVVPVVLLAVALVAAYLPARQATRVDPLVALRTE